MSYIEQAYSLLSKFRISTPKETGDKRDVGGNENVPKIRKESLDCTDVGHLQGQLAYKTQQLVCMVLKAIHSLYLSLRHVIKHITSSNFVYCSDMSSETACHSPDG